MNNPEFIINVFAQFLHKHTGEPLHGKDYSIRLFDKDPLKDDLLGETNTDSEGKVHFKINPVMYRSEDSPMEKNPDLYLVVSQDGTEIFRTPVAINFNFEDDGNFNYRDGEWIDMGTFLIEN